MRRLGVLLACGAAVGCGRWGFDSQDPAQPDAAQPDAPAPSGFVCNEPQRFSSGGVEVAAMTAVATTGGQAVFIVDTAGNLAAWTYENAEGMLVPTASNLAIDTDITTTISAASVGSSIVVSAVHGLASATGTKLYPRDAAGAAHGPAIEYLDFGADRALATSPGGQLAFISVAPSDEVQIQKIDTLGVATAPVTLAATTEMASYATIARGGPGYIAQWNADTASPSRLQLALLDDTFGVVGGPVQVNGVTTEYPIDPRVVWASSSNTYLVTWHEKNATDDDVWFQLRDGDLAPITLSAILGPSGCCAEVTSDGTDFWVAWLDFGSNQLQAARISPSGVVTPRPVTSSGGDPVGGVMLVNGSQPVLVWIESGGSGPEMWIDPMCL